MLILRLTSFSKCICPFKTFALSITTLYALGANGFQLCTRTNSCSISQRQHVVVNLVFVMMKR